MNFSETFIRSPIATSLLMLAIAMFGIIAYRALSVSDLPQVDYPTISVCPASSGHADSPSFRKTNPVDPHIIFLAVNSAGHASFRTRRIAEMMLVSRISMGDGVAQVQVFGAAKYAARE